ncbi:hypothetical protein [Oceanobacillus sojae]
MQKEVYYSTADVQENQIHLEIVLQLAGMNFDFETLKLIDV